MSEPDIKVKTVPQTPSTSSSQTGHAHSMVNLPSICPRLFNVSKERKEGRKNCFSRPFQQLRSCPDKPGTGKKFPTLVNRSKGILSCRRTIDSTPQCRTFIYIVTRPTCLWESNIDSNLGIVTTRPWWISQSIWYWGCLVRPKKRNCLFPVTVQKKNRVGRSVKKKIHYFFGQKCVFYACFTLIGSLEGGKNLR